MRKLRCFFYFIICLYLLFSAGESVPQVSAAELTASEACIEFIKGVEGFSPQPYYDYSQYTVGYGTKCPTEKYFEYKANGIPKEEAEGLLMEAVSGFEDAIHEKLISQYGLTLNQHQFDALVSFSYNLGTNWMTYDSTLRNAILKDADEDEMVYAFGLYCTAGEKYLPGLIKRRLCEANIYLNGVYDQKVSEDYGYVYYDANGGSLTYRVQGFVCDSNTVPIADAARNNDVFLGWYTNVTGGSLVSVLNGSLSGRTLFARWQSDVVPHNPVSTITAVMVTGDAVNVRSGPGTNYSIVRKAYQNEIVTVTHVSYITSMQWGKIQDGWICLDYTNYDAVMNGTEKAEPEDAPDDTDVPDTEETTEPVLLSGVVRVNDALRIRSGPGTGYSVVGFLFNGKEVDILEQQSDGTMIWGRISKGWISMDYVEISTIYEETVTEPDPLPQQEPEQLPEEQPDDDQEQDTELSVPEDPDDFTDDIESVSISGLVNADALRIRSGAGTGYQIVGYYYQNDAVVISEQVRIDSVYWGKTQKGWINMDYIVTFTTEDVSSETEDGTRMTVIADCLRVRKGTGTDYKIAQLLYYGDSVTVYETVTVDDVLWGKVDNGWICMDYVE